jgi:hypothetical protein
LEDAVVHRCEEILEPLVRLRVELVPEGDRSNAGDDTVPDLVESPIEHGGIAELGEIEGQEGALLAKDSFDYLFDAKRLSSSGWTKDANV